MRMFIAGLAVFLPFSSSLFASDPQLRPGLWEMSMQSDALRGMPAIPPEQLEQMRRMGITVPKMENNRMVTQVCLTKEMVERQQVPMMDKQQTGCEMQDYKRSGKQYSANMICDGPQMKGKGVVKGKLISAEQFESTFDFEGAVEGQPVKHQQAGSGKWIAADCGNVKPLQDMGKPK